MTLTKKILIGAGSLLGIGALFYAGSGSAQAAPSKGGGGGGGGGGNLPTPPFKAIVQSNVGGAMIVRDQPALTGKKIGDARNGTTVNVMKTGITPLDGSGGTWWQITDAAGVTGFSRGIDPVGYQNFRPA